MCDRGTWVTRETRDVATSVMPPRAQRVNLARPRSGPNHGNADLFSAFAAAQLGIRLLDLNFRSSVPKPSGRVGRLHHADSCLRGRPPLAPLALAAVAFAFERLRPPRCPVDRANRRVPKARSTSPGTHTSTSSDDQAKASPAGETLIELSAAAGTSS